MSKLRHKIGQKWKSIWRQSDNVNLMSRFWPLPMSFWCYFDHALYAFDANSTFIW